jgi:hypothetical protein
MPDDTDSSQPPQPPPTTPQEPREFLGKQLAARADGPSFLTDAESRVREME